MSDAIEIPWRKATREEIQAYYADEFPKHAAQIPDWLGITDTDEIAVALSHKWPTIDKRHENGIAVRDFLRRSTYSSGSPIWDSWSDLADFCINPVANDPLRGEHLGVVPQDRVPDSDKLETNAPPVAEALYAQLLHHDGKKWLLAFDIDADDVAAQRLRTADDDRPDNAILSDSTVTDDPPRSTDNIEYAYTYDDIQQAIAYAHDLKHWVANNLGCSNAEVFYSGQGAHLYILDDEPCYHYHMQSRRALTEYITDKLGIPIDVAVTYTDKRVLRVPYSLHAGVSRLVTAAPDPEFPYRTNETTVPAFIDQ
jgi:DNA primase catalytic subunit